MRYRSLALALFMLRRLADNTDDALATDNTTLVADLLHGWTDFHSVEKF